MRLTKSIFIVSVFSAVLMLSSCEANKKAAQESATTKTDSAPKTDIHTSEKVQGGTIIGGPAPDNSPAGEKPKQ